MIRIVLDAHQERLDLQHKQCLSLAWHIEAFARQKTLPDFSRLMGITATVQSDDEMWAATQRWVTMHNAKFDLSKQLGV